MSGTFENVHVVNSPARVFSVGNDDPLTLTGLVIDNCKFTAFNFNIFGTCCRRLFHSPRRFAQLYE